MDDLQPVVVEQAARDAAAVVSHSHLGHPQEWTDAMDMGEDDGHYLVQAFQRAILAEREACARMVPYRVIAAKIREPRS